MADTSIEWATKVWNPTTGCSRVSAGCDNCYAMHFARRFDGEGKGYDGTTRRSSRGTDWSGVVHQHEDRLELPLKWRKPQRVFVDSMSDLFHPAVSFGFIDKVFAVMALARQHTFMILTKRPERMREYLSSSVGTVPGSSRAGRIGLALDEMVGEARSHAAWGGSPWPLSNIWLGTSVEDQEAADKRIPHLLETPAAVRFLSCEPLLGPVDLEPYLWEEAGPVWAGKNPSPGIDWVIVGGESGRGARPMHPRWARRLRDDCAAAGVPFFHKQNGEYLLLSQASGLDLKHRHMAFQYGETFVRAGKKLAGRLLDGREHNEFPEVVR